MIVCVCVCVFQALPFGGWWEEWVDLFYLILVETHGWAPSFEAQAHTMMCFWGPYMAILDSDSGRDTVRGLLRTVDLLDSGLVPSLWSRLSFSTATEAPLVKDWQVVPLSDKGKEVVFQGKKHKETTCKRWYYYALDSWRVLFEVLWMQFHCSSWPSIEAGRHALCGWVVGCWGWAGGS